MLTKAFRQSPCAQDLMGSFRGLLGLQTRHLETPIQANCPAMLIDGRIFHPKFVRENLRDHGSWDPVSRQRLVNNISPDIRGVVEQGTCTSSGDALGAIAARGTRVVQCRFEDGSAGPFEMPIGHSTINGADIAAHPKRNWPEQDKFVEQLRVNALDFQGLETLIADGPSVDLAIAEQGVTETWRPQERQAVRSWIEDLQRDGIAIVKNMPAEPGQLAKFAQKLFGFVLPSVYGQTFTIKSRSKPNNLAYSALGLQLHTDLPYCQSVPPVQLFHCIQQAHLGGGNIFVDGFRVAEKLRARAPHLFDRLAITPVRFQDTTPSWKLHAEHCTIKVDSDGKLLQVNFNERARDSWHQWKETDGLLDLDAFYRALAEFEALLEDPREALHVTLKNGEMSVIDNWRVLHSREGFEGDRWLEGGYLTWEQVHSLWRVLAAGDT